MPELKPTAEGDETATGNANGRRHPARQLRNYLIAGLLIWIPVMVTVWVIKFLSGILDQSLVLLPPSWRPEALVGQYVPGVGIVLSFCCCWSSLAWWSAIFSAARSSRGSRTSSAAFP